MLTQEILKAFKADSKTEFAVMRRGYSSPRNRTPRRSETLMVTMVSTIVRKDQGVAVNVGDITDQNPIDSVFPSATTADGTVKYKGFLVTDGFSYWVCSAKNFVGIYSELDSVWVAHETQREAEEERRKRENDIVSAVRPQLEARAQDTKESLTKSIIELLGKEPLSVSVYGDGDWDKDRTVYTPRIGGSVQLSVQDFQRLLEVIYEAREAVA
jgi:hypothetical protein